METPTTLKLMSFDGTEFEVATAAITISKTISDLLEDAGAENAIPLPNVNEKLLRKVIEFCDRYAEKPDAKEDDPWYQEFCKVDQETLFELILAANYLDIKPLLNVACKTVADMIKGKTAEQIRETFNIENDFTPEEEERIRKENEWCEER